MKKFIAAITAITCLTVPVEAKTGNHEDHQSLFTALERVGVRIKLNDGCSKEFMGYYNYVANEMLICQENRGTFDESQVSWTEEDYDTLRHEAQHVIQDCVADGISSNEMTLMMPEHLDSIRDSLGDRAVNIAQVYEDRGPRAIQLEYEAFAVASNINARDIGETVISYCL